MSAQVFNSHATLTFNEGQGHSNWYQNIEFTSFYLHTKFERNWSVIVQMDANIQHTEIT